ncbi:MAG TPA: zf-HC2 domain-containing protein [Thermoanaerobaculia bacterium]|nr:zf-HC2 domain-containing protein [Thermoanaerobaculia bacterium]
MSFHIRDEMLSAYLDGEIEPARERTIDHHLNSCEECRARLNGMRGLVLELRRAPRLQPPPPLAHQVRQQVMEQAPAGVWESLRALLAGRPLHPAMHSVMAMGLALVLSVSLVRVEREQRLARTVPPATPTSTEEPVTDVQVLLGRVIYRQTTIQLGDIEFVLYDAQGRFVQEGLEGSEPETRVDSRSPEGRAVLTDRTYLGLVLDEGYSVVLSSKDGRTVEVAPPPLRGASSGWAGVHV